MTTERGRGVLAPAPTAVDPVRSAIMARIRSKNTAPELRVRAALHAAGLRFRVHRKDLPGNPDIVLPRFRMSVFVHGCFWHGHDCARGHAPRSNLTYWLPKIARNAARHQRAVRALKALGWRTQVIRECAIDAGIRRVLRRLGDRTLGV